MSLEKRLAAALSAAFPEDMPAALGVAVSGGGDSMALLHLLAGWAAPHGIALHAASVDHGLRAGSAGEAALAARACAALGVPHEILRWQEAGGWSGQGNLQAEARRARRALLAGWAVRRGLGHVALGHTLDDQAETVLLRLARGSGVDGLSGMAPRREAAGVVWLRPLLDAGRGELRDWLAARAIAWAEDPSNEDARFDRVRARALLKALAPLGLTAPRLARSAAQMRAAREVLGARAAEFAQAHARVQAGDLLLDAAALAAAQHETRMRVLAGALRWVSGAPYRPRWEALARAARALEAGRGFVLHGCVLSAADGAVRVGRDPRAVAGLRAGLDALWDGRWRLLPPEGTGTAGLHVAALGEAVAECPGWRNAGLPRASLQAGPAVWQGARLVAAPLVGNEEGWRAALDAGRPDFAAFLAAD